MNGSLTHGVDVYHRNPLPAALDPVLCRCGHGGELLAHQELRFCAHRKRGCDGASVRFQTRTLALELVRRVSAAGVPIGATR
jgi:hypothetical protein